MSGGYLFTNGMRPQTKEEREAEAIGKIQKIVLEYGLIQQKKSKLSRSKRISVIEWYNYLLEKGIIKEKFKI